MGYALKKTDQLVMDRRPNKILRHSSIQLINLGTYIQSAPPRAPETHPEQASAKSIAPQKREASEYVKLESQPFGTKAATNDTAFTQRVPEAQLHTYSKNRLTIVILSGLCIGSLVGYQWSSLLNQTPVVSYKAESEPVVNSVAIERVDSTDVAIAATTAPAASLTQTDASIDREQQYLQDEKEFLSQIDWLRTQNSDLVNELDALQVETIDQNRELLALELEVVALRSQSEPPTETRVIYNFVNVPIGTGVTTQYDEDTLEDNDSRLSAELEQQRAQYNDEGKLVYDLETGAYLTRDDRQDREGAGSPYSNSPQYPSDENASFETANSELLSELEQVRLRQFEAGLLDYDHETGTFVQKNFRDVNRQNNGDEIITFPPLPSE